ncbi:Tetratricopeptide repeat-like superfamily protein [Melia azedarach]|uniref:Tetratricopeptide repeat-like superfamily protein n=1 Tax=Melia azedarach TaxID=155640 RepID=A0ACC1WUA7_MELAZ|nr:Tetratricopeptide repeat-like superfamily protein [Melia azedarach]
MASKSRNMNKAIFFEALFGLFVGVIVCSCYHGLHKYLKEDSRSHIKDNLVYLHGIVTRSIRNVFITSTIKFLHFFVAKSLQFRFSSLLQSTSSIPSLLFWVAFTRAISSMADDYVCCNITSKAQ